MERDCVRTVHRVAGHEGGDRYPQHRWLADKGEEKQEKRFEDAGTVHSPQGDETEIRPSSYFRFLSVTYIGFRRTIRTTTVFVVRHMTPIQTLRARRKSCDITATLVALKARVNRSRLSAIERGYIQPTDEEMERLQTALNDLIQAKAAIQKTATDHGWPAARFA